ncbi:bile acid:sodium symporter family protein [Lewinella sp. LCG006]|uniref:bile acid:sodium symporter family protein n=1 Tax=Lewinella sp. LCG006 TaxID=3231911 RepID=UPI00345F4C32
MQSTLLTSTILPASLFIIMIGMGLSLTLDDFRRVVRYPGAVSLGLFNQLILLPIIGLGLCHLFALTPLLAVGLLLLTACPGGATSNLISYVAKGDVALSVTLTAISSTVTIFTIPLIVHWGLAHFLGESRPIELPILETMGQIFGITALPVSIGMLVRSRNLTFAQRMERPMRIASTVIFVLILAGIVVANWQTLLDALPVLGPATLMLNLLTVGLGWGLSRIFGLNLAQSITIAIESGIQNGTLAIVVASSILYLPEMSLPAAIYTIFMFLTGGAFMWRFGRREVKVD